MKHSTSRILTSHAGSLPRPTELFALLHTREAGKPLDPAVFDAEVRRSVDEVVKHQAEVGIDVPNDGEMSKISYGTYIKDRVNGFGGEQMPTVVSRYAEEFPEWVARSAPTSNRRPTCNGPLSWKDFGALQRDIDALKAATKGSKFEEVFMTSASPGIISFFLQNRYYPSETAYLDAIADVMKREYDAIVKAGFHLQLDVPEVALGANSRFAELPLREFRRVMAEHIESLNEATEKIPAEQMRIHVCWGKGDGPHNHDVPLKDMVDLILKAKPVGISIMACNPRHEHEWKVWKDVKVPREKVLMPGVIDATTNYIEHPELVAERLVKFASVVGRENVIAGTDCGVGSAARANPLVVPKIAWAKLQAMSEGAKLATKELWARGGTRAKRASATRRAAPARAKSAVRSKNGSGARSARAPARRKASR